MNDEFSDPSAQGLPVGDSRLAWSPPAIEDADISAITNGGGNSGIEGSPFLKTGS